MSQTVKISFYIDDTTEPADNELLQKVQERFNLDERNHEDRRYGPNNKQYVEGITFHRDEEGLYVQYDHVMFAVPTALTDKHSLRIRRVEIYETFPIPYRDEEPVFTIPNGHYTEGEATAIVDEYTPRDVGRNRRLRVVAPDIQSGVTLLHKIRAGQATPTNPWTDKPAGQNTNNVTPISS